MAEKKKIDDGQMLRDSIAITKKVMEKVKEKKDKKGKKDKK